MKNYYTYTVHATESHVTDTVHVNYCFVVTDRVPAKDSYVTDLGHKNYSYVTCKVHCNK